MRQDTADRSGIRLLGYSDLGGDGSGLQLMLKGQHLFVGRQNPGQPMLILDVSDPLRPYTVAQMPLYPHTWHSKCQLSGDLLLVNYEQRFDPQPGGRTGWAVFDVSEPTEPKELAFVDTGGKGAHRLWWAGERHCYISCRPKGFRERMLEIYDLQVPEKPELVGRWWTPGLWQEGGEAPPAPSRNGARTFIHHGIHHDGRLYCGYWDGGVVIFDVSDPTNPQPISRYEWEAGGGGMTHTTLPLPGRQLLAVTDEAGQVGDPQNPKYFRLLDIADERNPVELSRWRPDHEVYGSRGGRYGPHNLHENRPGTFQSEETLFATFFNAGLRVLDISDARNPRETAYYVPPATPGQPICATNDILVSAEGRIYITDKWSGGLHILELE